MTERDELPEGWTFTAMLDQGWAARRISDGRNTASFWARRTAIAAAWRIVDAEAIDGNQVVR